MLRKLKVFVLLLIFMGVLGNTSILHADIFKIDEFIVDKYGSSFFPFDDPFSDGIAPPSAPNYANGNAAFYNVLGTIGPESGGKLTLDTSQGDLTLNTNETGYSRTVRATLRTSTLGGGSGLNSNSIFGVMGIYDLAQPSRIGTRYDIRLYDGLSGVEGNDNVILGVRRAGDGNVYIQFNHYDNILNTTTLIDRILFTPGPNDDQIALSLIKDNAGNSLITAGFAYIDNGVIGEPYIFGNTTAIFNGETFTRASFGALETYVPEPSSMLLLGFGLAVIAGLRRKFSR